MLWLCKVSNLQCAKTKKADASTLSTGSARTIKLRNMPDWNQDIGLPLKWNYVLAIWCIWDCACAASSTIAWLPRFYTMSKTIVWANTFIDLPQCYSLCSAGQTLIPQKFQPIPIAAMHLCVRVHPPADKWEIPYSFEIACSVEQKIQNIWANCARFICLCWPICWTLSSADLVTTIWLHNTTYKDTKADFGGLRFFYWSLYLWDCYTSLVWRIRYGAINTACISKKRLQKCTTSAPNCLQPLFAMTHSSMKSKCSSLEKNFGDRRKNTTSLTPSIKKAKRYGFASKTNTKWLLKCWSKTAAIRKKIKTQAHRDRIGSKHSRAHLLFCTGSIHLFPQH